MISSTVDAGNFAATWIIFIVVNTDIKRYNSDVTDLTSVVKSY